MTSRHFNLGLSSRNVLRSREEAQKHASHTPTIVLFGHLLLRHFKCVFIHSFIQQVLMSSYSVPETVLGAAVTAGKK